MIYLIACISVVATFFLWSFIHEMSHVLAVKRTTGLRQYKIKLYPHFFGGTFCWARTTWISYRKADPLETVEIYLSPRIPNALACFLLPLAWVMPNFWLLFIWIFVWGGGIIDLFNGSVGWSSDSDLKIASCALEISPWYLRVAGFSLGVVSIASTVLTLWSKHAVISL